MGPLRLLLVHGHYQFIGLIFCSAVGVIVVSSRQGVSGDLMGSLANAILKDTFLRCFLMVPLRGFCMPNVFDASGCSLKCEKVSILYWRKLNL